MSVLNVKIDDISNLQKTQIETRKKETQLIAEVVIEAVCSEDVSALRQITGTIGPELTAEQLMIALTAQIELQVQKG